MSRHAVRVNSLLRTVFYRSRPVTRMMFGVRTTAFGYMSFWELGTVAMWRALRAELRPGMRALEIGTGPHALLALWAARRGAQVTATDISPEYLEHATRTAACNDTHVELLRSDLLEAVDGSFDLIWFVPPNISAATLRLEIEILGMKDVDEIAEFTGHACGGEAGWEIIARYFEQARRKLAPRGRVLVAVNGTHVSADTLDSLAAAAGLRPLKSFALPVAPHRALVFG